MSRDQKKKKKEYKYHSKMRVLANQTHTTGRVKYAVVYLIIFQNQLNFLL